MIYKDGVLNFTVTQSGSSPVTTGIQFSTQDVATAKLTFRLTKDGVPLPLSAVSGCLAMLMVDGSRFIREISLVDKVNGIAEYVLSDAEIKHYGQVNAELYLYYANGQSLSVHKFGFSIDQALIDQNIVPVAEYYIDDFESLKAKINELYDEVIETVDELREKFSDLENIETKAGAQEKADAALSAAKAYTDQHAENKENPHNVTKAQVGLENVDNVKQAAKRDFDTHVSDDVRHVTTEDRNAWNSAEGNAKAYIDLHEKRKDNPHEVTKAQVGLDKVDNVQQASLADFNAHNFNSVRHVVQADKDKWNGAQLFKLTQDSGKVFYKSDTETTNYNDLTASGMYLIANPGLNGPAGITSSFLHVMSNGTSLVQAAYDAVSGAKSFYRIRKSDATTWTSWNELISPNLIVPWQTPSLSNGWKQYTVSGSEHPLQYSKDALGVVAVCGAIAGGTLGSTVTAFTLPEGCRPPYPFYHVGTASSSGAGGTPQIFRSVFNTDGSVCVQSCSNTENPNGFISFSARFSTKEK